eukprot:526701-Pyramimonas_sp.AAC.1
MPEGPNRKRASTALDVAVRGKQIQNLDVVEPRQPKTSDKPRDKASHVPVGPVRKAVAKCYKVAVRVGQVEGLDGAEVSRRVLRMSTHSRGVVLREDTMNAISRLRRLGVRGGHVLQEKRSRAR